MIKPSATKKLPGTGYLALAREYLVLAERFEQDDQGKKGIRHIIKAIEGVEKELRKGKKFKLLLGLVALLGVELLLIAYVLPETTETWSILSEFVRDFGIAAIISALLGLSVDQMIRFRLASEVAKDVAALMYHERLPPEISAELVAAQDVSLVRRKLRVSATLADTPISPTVLQFTIDTSWDLENLSGVSQTFSHRWALKNDKHAELRPARVVHAYGYGAALGSPGYNEQDTADKPLACKTEEQDSSWARPVEILPSSPENPRSARFGNLIEFLVDRSDQEILLYDQAVIGLEVELRAKKGIHAEVVFIHRSQSMLKPTQLAEEGDYEVKRYRYDRVALLPKTGFTITWG